MNQSVSNDRKMKPKSVKTPFYRRWMAAFLAIFFRLLYHQFAWFYDSFASLVSLGRWKTWVLSVQPYVTGSSVLEIGHGPGHLLEALLECGVHAVGLDESWQMSALAFKRLRKRSFESMLVNGYAQFFPFSSTSFDQVVATFPSEYISHPATLAEISRILTPNGQLIVVPFARITGPHWSDRLAAWLFRVTGQAPKRQQPMQTYARPFTQTFEQNGFFTQVQCLELVSSQVLVIVATKAPHAKD
jgi:ubiquinone/menaquinone biosynthesis C-methylase UbiE